MFTRYVATPLASNVALVILPLRSVGKQSFTLGFAVETSGETIRKMRAR